METGSSGAAPSFTEDQTREPPPPPLSTTAPFEEEVTPVEVPVTLASGTRLTVAWVVDLGLVLFVGIGVAALETMIFGAHWRTDAAGLLDRSADWIAAHSAASLHGTIVALLFGVGYNLVVGGRGARTLGRLLTGTVLVRASGRKLGWPLITVRSIGSLFSFLLFGAGFFWSLLDSKRRTWHDLIAGTVLVCRRVDLSSVEAADPEPQPSA